MKGGQNTIRAILHCGIKNLWINICFNITLEPLTNATFPLLLSALLPYRSLYFLGGGKSVSNAKIVPTEWRRALLMTMRGVCVFWKFVCGLFNYLTQFTVPICFSRIVVPFSVSAVKQKCTRIS